VLIPAATPSGSAAGRAVHSLPFHVPITVLPESIEVVIAVQSPALTQDTPSTVLSRRSPAVPGPPSASRRSR
jgi:hypothetical protein